MVSMYLRQVAVKTESICLQRAVNVRLLLHDLHVSICVVAAACLEQGEASKQAVHVVDESRSSLVL